MSLLGGACQQRFRARFRGRLAIGTGVACHETTAYLRLVARRHSNLKEGVSELGRERWLRRRAG
jgi:hypothetical protein